MSKYATATVEGFTEYHEARGNVIPATADDADIEAMLLVASEWLDNNYGRSFVGEKVDGFLQEREWPRENATVTIDPAKPYTIPKTEIPVRVINAVYEAALKQLVAPGTLTKDFTPNKYNKVAIDGAVSVEYAMNSSASEIQSVFPLIDALLAPLIDTSASFSSYSTSSSRV